MRLPLQGLYLPHLLGPAKFEQMRAQIANGLPNQSGQDPVRWQVGWGDTRPDWKMLHASD